MMSSKFQACLDFLLSPDIEGGFSNNPSDPGGPTNYGITKATYDHYCHLLGSPPRDIKKISMAEVDAIYDQFYWSTIAGEALPQRMAMVVFDAAVNCGQQNSIMFLQGALNDVEKSGLEVDGKMGPKTLNAVAHIKDFDDVLKTAVSHRAKYYQEIIKINPSLSKFNNDWQKRMDLLDKAVGLVAPTPAPKVAEKVADVAQKEDKTKKE